MLSIYDSILIKQNKVNEKIKDIIGLRIYSNGQKWELTGANDIYYPYFSRVVSNKVQQKQFTISGYTPEWLLNLI